MKTRIVTIVMFVLFTTNLVAQTFDLSAEIRPRYENKHGYKTLQPTDADGSNFISQRTRLNFGFKNETLKAYVSFQNIRVWGDVSTLSSDDNATALHEAWADVRLAKNLSLKLGRQEIVYDDHRIFGSVGWAQQARSHDAFIFKFKPNKDNRLDVGFALNSDSQAGSDNLYSNAAGYKTFQYLWYHGNFNKIGLSFLLLNSGNEYENTDAEQKIAYRQTIGPRLTFKQNKLSANAAVYYQTGSTAKPTDTDATDVSALYYTANFGYKVSDNFKVALGYEYLSGNDNSDSKLNTFAPLFGTNHKFNGWMDYFYVGYNNPTGLQDINATFAYKKGKFSAKLIPHLFSAASDVYNGSGDKMDSALGTEIDLTLGYKVSKAVKISGGYSQMLATDTMEVIKMGDKDEHNSWAWIMFTIKPKLFSHTIKK
jgi:hypothetical protein